MIMHIAYLKPDPQTPIKVKREKKLTKQQIRVRAWIARQDEREYRKAIKENWENILKIQKVYPGWLPSKHENK